MDIVCVVSWVGADQIVSVKDDRSLGGRSRGKTSGGMFGERSLPSPKS